MQMPVRPGAAEAEAPAWRPCCLKLTSVSRFSAAHIHPQHFYIRSPERLVTVLPSLMECALCFTTTGQLKNWFQKAYKIKNILLCTHVQQYHVKIPCYWNNLCRTRSVSWQHADMLFSLHVMEPKPKHNHLLYSRQNLIWYIVIKMLKNMFEGVFSFKLKI